MHVHQKRKTAVCVHVHQRLCYVELMFILYNSLKIHKFHELNDRSLCSRFYTGMCLRWSAVVGIGHHSKVVDHHSSPPTTYLAAATDLRLGIKRLEIVTTVRLAVAACRTSSRTITTALTARKRGHYNLQRAQLLFILSILPVFFQLVLNNALCSATTIII